jgi:hypothetical protein
VFDTGASAYRLLAIFDSRLHSSLLSMPSANSPYHQRIRTGLSAASQRLDIGGHMQQPFQLANSFQCNTATRPSLPHVFSTGILARVGNLADLAIPCFCLKPLSHTMTAPFLPPLSSVRRSALYPRAICSGQISVRRGGKSGFSSGFVPC